MLNTMRKRESNYCRETIRELLSKTRCLGKLMDQQSTAVSFPIPFSCMSVLSNHLTLTMQAGSLQLARSWLPCSFTGATISNYICTARDGSLIVCDIESLVQGKGTLVLTSNRTFRFYSVWTRKATPRVGATCFTLSFSGGYFLCLWAGNQKCFYENTLLWDSQTKTLISTSDIFSWGQSMLAKFRSKKELDQIRTVFLSFSWSMESSWLGEWG